MSENSSAAAYHYPYKGGDVIKNLEEQQLKLASYLEPLTEKQAESGYAAGKWSVKELLGHLIDTERIMAYRALAIARGEQQPLPGFDENLYVENARFNEYPLGRLLIQYHAQRNSTIQLVASFTPEMLSRTGIANGAPITVNEIAEKIAAHEQHHIAILEERYLSMWH